MARARHPLQEELMGNYFGFAPPTTVRSFVPRGHRYRPSEALEQKDQIVKCLKENGGATITEVAALVDIDTDIVRIRLRVLENDGKARRTERKRLATASRHETIWETV
jgi:hypothetical protein